MAITNLNQYYSSIGQTLPSVSQRQGVASQAGISNYTGTAEQNGTLLSYLQNTPSQNSGNVITGDNLQPETPIKLPEPKSNPYTGFNSSLNSLLADTKTKIATDQTEYDKQVAELGTAIKNQGNTGAYNESVYAKEGVDAKRNLVNSLSGQLEAEQNALIDRLDAVEKRSGGLTSGAMAEQSRLSSESARTQARLGIALSASARSYDTASNIATRLITANSEAVKADIESRKFVLEQLGTKLATEQANAFDIQLKQIDNENSLLQDAVSTATAGAKDGSIDGDVAFNAVQDLLSGNISISEFYNQLGSNPDANQTGSDIAGYDITSYATDPTHEQKVLSIYNSMGSISNTATADSAINSLSPNSPITGDMVMSSAEKYSVDPALMIAIMQQDSSLGTAGIGARNHNPGNIGQFDELGTTPTDGYKTWQEGVDAVASWLSRHKAIPDTSQDYIYGDFKAGLSQEGLKAFSSLKDSDKSVVMQLVNGDALIADLVKSRGGAGTTETQRLAQLAMKVDPTYSIANEKIRYEYKKNWDLDATKGNVGTRTAINTALAHLAELKELSDELPAGTVKQMNSAKNVLNRNFGDPAVTNFRIALNALSAELARVYKGGVPNEGEIIEWQNALSESFSQNQFDGAFDTASKLLSGKLTALRYGYKSTMGREYSQSLIDPDKRQALIDAGLDPSSIAKENIPQSSLNDPLLESFNNTETPIVPQSNSVDFWGDLFTNVYGGSAMDTFNRMNGN